MALKKSELYQSIWKSCDQLRGGMDASQYKDYVLVLLFMKYVTDKYYGKTDALLDVPKRGSFHDMVAAKGKVDIGDRINKIITKLAEANELVGVITVADFDDDEKLGRGKDKQDRLSNLVAIFQDERLNFSRNRASDDDLLGDAYEYLMRNFATESGKSKGQFYTPSEVSQIIAKVIGINQAKSQTQTIYDPTCGSGSLLLKAVDETETGVTIYGQEMDNATTALAKMNMILHNNPTAMIWNDNTLARPYFKDDNGALKTFDFVIANPPFSNKSWSNGIDPENDEYERFTGYGIPPEKNGDYAFLLHIIRSLKSKGKGACILPHGVLFRGNTEGDIRKNLIIKGYIKGIIGLPANLFYGTGIPACIVVVDKENARGRKGIFMIDGSKGFIKDGNKNRLRAQDIHKIVDVFTNTKEVAKYSRLVPYAEIEKNEYNLNLPRYIDSQEEEDIHDISAHLKGDIPMHDVEALADYWQVMPELKTILFKEAKRKNYYSLQLPENEIRKTILEHPEFIDYFTTIKKTFAQWKKVQTEYCKNLGKDVRPKDVIFTISEAILKNFSNKPLLDNYDIYQHLMNYWAAIMQDDVFTISQDGWKAELYKTKETKKEIIWDCDILPKTLIQECYFSKELGIIQKLEEERDELNSKMEEIIEEHGGEEGLLEEVMNDNRKISKANLTRRIQVINSDSSYAEEAEVLHTYSKLYEKESQKSKEIKDAQKDLEEKALKKYRDLTIDDIKTIVVQNKWIKSIETDIDNELERISQTLSNRIKELAERYSNPLPQLADHVEDITLKVDEHLKKMGFKW